MDIQIWKRFTGKNVDNERFGGRFLLLVQCFFFLILILLVMRSGYFPSLPIVFVILSMLFIWFGESRRILIVLLPFVILLLSYEAMRAYADNLAPGAVHVEDVIGWELTLLRGHILPSLAQRFFIDQPFNDLLNGIAQAFYGTHFVVPVVLAVIIWRNCRQYYWPYMLGLTVLSYVGFITFLLFPAAPPWWATYFGYLTGDQAILSYPMDPEILLLSPNPVAAVPSLHAAYPAYYFAVCCTIWRRKALLALILPVAVSLSAVFLGHHYLVDILLGIVYGVAIWWLVFRPLQRYFLVRLDDSFAIPGAVPQDRLTGSAR